MRTNLAGIFVTTLFVCIGAQAQDVELTAVEIPQVESTNSACHYFDNESARLNCEREYRLSHEIIRCDLDGDSWQVRRKVDPITDKMSCSVNFAGRNATKGGPAFFVLASGISFSILGDSYPGEPMSIRVDKQPAHTFNDALTGSEATKLRTEIEHGQLIRTRYNEWPSHVNRDASFPICDLPAKMRQCL